MSGELAEFCEKEGFTTKSGAILHCIKSALKTLQNDANLTQAPIHAYDKTSSYINNNINYGNDVPNSSFPNSRKKFDSKKAPPTELPSDWTPPDHLTYKYCERYGLDYPEALTLFKSMMAEKGERSRNWDQTWNIKIMKGALKTVPPNDEDEFSPQDTMAFRLGRSD